MLYNSFVLSNLNYCPLIWMFSGKPSKTEINRIHKHALRVLLDDYESTFEELLQKKSEHTTNVQTLLLGVYKCLTSKIPPFCGIFSNVGPQITILEKRISSNYQVRKQCDAD